MKEKKRTKYSQTSAPVIAIVVMFPVIKPRSPPPSASWEPGGELPPAARSVSCESQSPHGISELRPTHGAQCVSVRGGRASSSGQSGWSAAGVGLVRQSLSEPTADDPFRFLFGALGFESSSS